LAAPVRKKAALVGQVKRDPAWDREKLQSIGGFRTAKLLRRPNSGSLQGQFSELPL
jgi:hypothetical protein